MRRKRKGCHRHCARAGFLRDSFRWAHTCRNRKVRRDYLLGLPVAWGHSALRRDRQRGHARDRSVGARDRSAACIWRPHLRHAGAGDRPRRTENGEQGIRSSAGGSGDGEFEKSNQQSAISTQQTRRRSSVVSRWQEQNRRPSCVVRRAQEDSRQQNQEQKPIKNECRIVQKKTEIVASLALTFVPLSSLPFL